MSERIINPPKLAQWILSITSREQNRPAVLGDFQEFFQEIVKDEGRITAKWWYWRQALLSVPGFLRFAICWRIVMLKKNFRIAFRNMRKQKAFTFINIFGLAVGMACCLLILLWVQDELSYDRYHENADRIYRVSRLWRNGDGSISLHLGPVAPTIAPLLKNDFPEIEHAVRLWSVGGLMMQYGNKQFQERNIFFAEEDLFKVFSFNMIKGDPNSALTDPGTIVITESMAERYFGSEDPMGKVLSLDAYGQNVDFKVTGLIEDMPHNSHFHAACFPSFKTYEMFVGEEELKSWSSNNYPTYLLMEEGYHIRRLQQQLGQFLERHYYEGSSEETELVLWPITSIHLHSHLDSELEANSDINNIYIFSAIAFFILVIACINFMNLSTAKSAGRAKEVGLRKVVGARRFDIVRQFLNESVIIAFCALVLGILMVLLALPAYNQFIGKQLTFGIFQNITLISGLLGITLFVGFVAGSYPALYLSSFRPVRVLNQIRLAKSKKITFRTILVIVQFSISIILIISVTVVNNQLSFMRNKKLGFDKEHVVTSFASQYMESHIPLVKQELLSNPNILKVSFSKRIPSGRLADCAGARVLGGPFEGEIDFRIANLLVDHDYISTFGMELAAGRDFSMKMRTDSTEAFILNETAVRQIGWESPQEAIDQPFGYGRRNGRIIGVVKDFHFESMHQPISPVVLHLSRHSLYRVAIRIRPENIPGTLAFFEEKCSTWWGEYPFEYSFLDERFDQLYQSEEKLHQIFNIFSFLSVLIACLGLFGLASYDTEQRIKEIGIRKVLGASVTGIVGQLSAGFLKWVLIANVIAWPVAYVFMNHWLQSFAYRTSLTPIVFILSGVLALVIALATVAYHALKAALCNPVEALRYE